MCNVALGVLVFRARGLGEKKKIHVFYKYAAFALCGNFNNPFRDESRIEGKERVTISRPLKSIGYFSTRILSVSITNDTSIGARSEDDPIFRNCREAVGRVVVAKQ